jgi:hypothetical protein
LIKEIKGEEGQNERKDDEDVFLLHIYLIPVSLAGKCPLPPIEG